MALLFSPTLISRPRTTFWPASADYGKPGVDPPFLAIFLSLPATQSTISFTNMTKVSRAQRDIGSRSPTKVLALYS